jgi:hypothetical protein
MSDTKPTIVIAHGNTYKVFGPKDVVVVVNASAEGVDLDASDEFVAWAHIQLSTAEILNRYGQERAAHYVRKLIRDERAARHPQLRWTQVVRLHAELTALEDVT